MLGGNSQPIKEAYINMFGERLLDKPTAVLERYKRMNGPKGFLDLFKFLYSKRNWKDVAISRVLEVRKVNFISDNAHKFPNLQRDILNGI